MHYCCLVITREFPSDQVLEKALEPYNEDLFYENKDDGREYPVFMWDWWKIGGRYTGQFKLKVEKDCEKYGWKFYSREPRAGRLFRSLALENIRRLAEKTGSVLMHREEDYYGSMGFNDDFLYVDGGLIKDISNYLEAGCFCFVDADGHAETRSYYDGKSFTDDPEFEEKLKAALSASEDFYVCTVDLHD